jgi:hypothetical protein
VRVGHAVERSGLRPRIPSRTEHRQPSRERLDRLGETALVTIDITEIPRHSRPPLPVTVVLEDLRCPREESDGFVVAPELAIQGAQAAHDPGLGVRVARLPGSVEG